MASYQDAFNKEQEKKRNSNKKQKQSNTSNKKQKSFREKFREEKDKGSKTFEYPEGSGKRFTTITKDEVEAGRRAKNIGTSSNDYGSRSYQDAPKPVKQYKYVPEPSVQSTAPTPVDNRVKGTTNVKTEPKKRGSVFNMMKAGGPVKAKKKTTKKFRADGIAKRGKTKGRMI